MTTSFPGSLDTFVNPTASDTLDSATVPHAAQHDNLNDAVKAVETALGANLVNVAQIASANTFTTSPQQITVNAAGNKGLIVKGAASQTANLQEWQNSAGPALSYIGSNGAIVSQGTIYVNGNSIVDAYGTNSGTRIRSTTSANAVVLTSFGNANQTGDMFQLVNSSSTVLSGVNAAGQIYAGTTASVVGSTTTAITSAAYTSATVAVFTYGGTSLVQAGQRVTVAGVTGGTYNGTWVVSAVTSTTFTVLGSGFTNVAGSGGTFQLSAVGTFVAGTAAITPIIVRGAASQTANLQEWQNSAGTTLTAITPTGTINFASGNTSATATAGAVTAPALVVGFITMQIAGTTVKVPYYAN